MRRRFAELLGITDARYLERCFSGEPVTLRSGLDRKTAADLYRRLQQLGALTQLQRETADAGAAPPAPPPQAEPPPQTEPPPRQREGGVMARHADHVDQKWAVSDAGRLRAAQAAAERAAAAQRAAEEEQAAEAARRQRQAARQQQEADKAAQAAARQRAAEERRREKAAAARRKAEARAAAKAERAKAREQARAAAAQQAARRQADARQRAREDAARLHVEAVTSREQPGAAESRTQPNPYAMYPFRATADLRERPARAQQLKERYLALTSAAFIALVLAVAGRSLLLPPPPPAGPTAMAPLHGGGLVLVTPDRLLLHDRAGVGSAVLPLAALGLSAVEQVQPVPEGRQYDLLGRAAGADPALPGEPGLWRCALEEAPACEPFGPQAPPPVTFATHPYLGLQVQALPAPGGLRKLDSEGEILATGERHLGAQARLFLQDGLLYTNSSEAPALSVLRYEDGVLGKQLDEVLLLAPEAVAAGRERVGDFTFLGDKWWVILYHPQSGERGLYLFDKDWGYLREVELPAGFQAQRLLAWGDKLLVLDPAQAALQRFNSEAQREAPLRSGLLAAMIEDAEQERWLYRLLWQGLVTVLLLAFAACAGLTYLHHLRQLAFKPGWIRGAEPIEGDNAQIHWLDAPEAQYRAVRRTAHLYLAAACLVVAGAALLQVEPHHLAALLLLLAGPAFALWFYLRSRVGHIGVVDDQLLLVDHRRTYHLGQGSRILYRGWFLMIDDVLVYTGPHWFPAFAREQLQQYIVPLAQLGVRVDRRSVLARLVEARHPLALGGGIILMTTLASLSTLLA